MGLKSFKVSEFLEKKIKQLKIGKRRHYSVNMLDFTVYTLCEERN